MKTKIYSDDVIKICLRLRYNFEDSYKDKLILIKHSNELKSRMWKIFLDEKLKSNLINKYIYDISLEEFLNPNDYPILKSQISHIN